ncbi:MAG: hypothetical protein OEL79_07290, partial [Chromatiales bacterium]|nr:hypothetical protein [Chromatiales bacterium]
FLQGMAFAALAFHFSAEENRESAQLFVCDALAILPGYLPACAGVQVQPVLDSLGELQDRLHAADMTQSLNVISSVRALRFSAGVAA